MTQVIAPGPTTTRAVLTPPSKPLLPKRPRSGWPLSLAMMLCLGVVAGGFGGVLQEFEWWFVVFAALAIVLCTAATVRALTRRPWLPTVSAIVAAIVTPTLFFAADASLLGLIPTLDTVDRFQDLIRAGSDSITVQNVPATPTAGIVFLLVIGFDKMYSVYMRSVRQKVIPVQDFGKTVGVITLLNNLPQPLAGLAVALLASPLGTQTVILLLTAITALIGVAVASGWYATVKAELDVG